MDQKQIDYIDSALETYPILGQAVDRLRAMTLHLNLARRPRYRWTETPDKELAEALLVLDDRFTQLASPLVKQMLLYGSAKLILSPTSDSDLRVSFPSDNPEVKGKGLNFKFQAEAILHQAAHLCEQRHLLTDGSLMVPGTKQVQGIIRHLDVEIHRALRLPLEFFKPNAPLLSDRQLMSKHPATWDVVKRLRVLIHKGFTRVCQLYFEHLGVEEYEFEVLVPPKPCT